MPNAHIIPGAQDIETTIASVKWEDVRANDDGNVTINDLGLCLRQRGLDVSNFVILKAASDGTIPKHRLHQETFATTKDKLVTALTSKPDVDPEEKTKINKELYLELWTEYSGSKTDSGQIPLCELQNVVFGECNPTRDLLDTLIAIKKHDEHEELTFDEFCDMLEHLPSSGMINEESLVEAFRMEDADGTGHITRMQLYKLLVENGSDPLTKEEVDEMMDDCGEGQKFIYSDWIQRVITIKSITGK